MNLTQLYEILDDAIENELSITFLCNEETAEVITEYLDDYDMEANLYYTLKGDSVYFKHTYVHVIGEPKKYNYCVDNAKDLYGKFKSFVCDKFYAIGDYKFDEFIKVVFSFHKEIHKDLVITEEDMKVRLQDEEDYYDYNEEECTCDLCRSQDEYDDKEDDECTCDECQCNCDEMCCPECGEPMDIKNVKITVYDWDEIEELDLPETDMMVFSMIEHFVNEMYQTQGNVKEIVEVVKECANIFGGIGMMKMDRKHKGIE